MQYQPSAINSPGPWTQLFHWGLQVAGASFITSSILGQAACRLIKADAGPTALALVNFWVILGGLCLLPLIGAMKRRFFGPQGLRLGMHHMSEQDVWSCRYGLAFSFFAGLSWWLAPSLSQLH